GAEMALDVESGGRAHGWPELEFRTSPGRSLAAVTGSVGFALIGAAMAFGVFDGIKPWSQGWIAGWASLIFFTLCGAVWLKQALMRGPILTIGPRGVRDTRLSRDWIPWAAITAASETSIRGTHLLMLCIDPAFEATMSLTRVARWTKPMNAAL